jgi:hypothetical protein
MCKTIDFLHTVLMMFLKHVATEEGGGRKGEGRREEGGGRREEGGGRREEGVRKKTYTHTSCIDIQVLNATKQTARPCKEYTHISLSLPSHTQIHLPSLQLFLEKTYHDIY